MRYLQYDINGVTKHRPITTNVIEVYKTLKSREEISKLSPVLKNEIYSNFKIVNK